MILVEISSRKDAIMLAQLHSGHSNLLRAYRHVIDPLVDPTCPKCGEGQHTVEHWLTECSALATTQLHLFGSLSLNQLSLQPAKSVTLDSGPPFRRTARVNPNPNPNRNPNPRNGGPPEWRTSGMADPRNGGPPEWRTPGMGGRYGFQRRQHSIIIIIIIIIITGISNAP